MIKRTVLTTAVVAALFAATDGSAQTRSRAEVEAAREQARFRGMDTNNDGVITRREWRGNARAFDRFDTNRDGILSGTEIWISGQREESRFEDEVMQSFYRADRNNDGRLSRNEWWSDAATFSRIDRNRDGLLTREEYLGTDDLFDVPVGTTGTDAQKQTRAYQLAYQRGLTEGRQAGKEDKEGPNTWDLDGQRELEQADSGYLSEMGRREDYQAGYRAGFRVGYRQGFGPRR